MRVRYDELGNKSRCAQRVDTESGGKTAWRTSKKPANTVKPWRILLYSVRAIHGQRIFGVYVIFLAACCIAFRVLEPETFTSIGNAIWYCFEAVTTIGFGDITPTHPICRVLSIVIGLSALIVVALLTGIVVNYFTRRMQLANKESLAAFGYQMEHLTELSSDELAELERRYKTFMEKTFS